MTASSTQIRLVATEDLLGSTDATEYVVSGVSAGNDVSGATVSGNVITIILVRPIVPSDTVTVTYTGSALTDVAGKALAGFNDFAVTNSVSSVPEVVQVSAPTGSYENGDTVPITIRFSEPVAVTGIPQLLLETGVDDGTAHYTSGSGTAQLLFEYAVSAGHVSNDLNYVDANSLTLDGGSSTITSADDGTTASPVLPITASSDSLGGSIVAVDASAPVIRYVTGRDFISDLNFIRITVQFDKPVVVDGFPLIFLETGTADNFNFAEYGNHGNPDSINFYYVVSDGHSSDRLNYIDTDSLVLNGGSITSRDNVPASLTLPATTSSDSLGGRSNLVVDGINPTITSIVVTDATRILLTASEPLAGTVPADAFTVSTRSLSSTPVLSVDILDDTITLVPSTPILPGDTVSVSYQDIGITDVSTNILDFFTMGATNAVSSSADPTIVSVVAPSGAYKEGDTVPITVTFSEPVTVSGIPQLLLETGATDTLVDYASSPHTFQLLFNYLVGSDDNSIELNYRAADSLSLNDGSILAVDDNRSADLTLPAALAFIVPTSTASLVNDSVIIDTIAPTFQSAIHTLGRLFILPNAIPSNLLGFQSAIHTPLYSPFPIVGTVRIMATEPLPTIRVDITQFSISDGVVITFGNFARGSIQLTLSSIITDNTHTISYDGTGKHADVAGNPLAPFSDQLIIERRLHASNPAPQVVSVDAANASYTAGEDVLITVTFSKPVDVSGTPQLLLETGINASMAGYTSGSGSAELLFTYTVPVGDTSDDLNYVNTNSLSGGGGIVSADDRTPAILGLPALASPNSLAGRSDVVIDSIIPEFSFAETADANTVVITVSEPLAEHLITEILVSQTMPYLMR